MAPQPRPKFKFGKLHKANVKVNASSYLSAFGTPLIKVLFLKDAATDVLKEVVYNGSTWKFFFHWLSRRIRPNCNLSLFAETANRNLYVRGGEGEVELTGHLPFGSNPLLFFGVFGVPLLRLVFMCFSWLFLFFLPSFWLGQKVFL